MSDPAEVCHGCSKPILFGEARYAGSEGADPPKFWHWECHERWKDKTMESLRNVPSLIERARRLIREIEGGR